MSIVPQGKAIQAMYRDYRDGSLLVNRKYQRKLVWLIKEKRDLIDSILNGYPIPLILLAEQPNTRGKYEIVDGVQRLNAIFSFIEQAFDLNGRYFDVAMFPTAKQHADAGCFDLREGVALCDPKDCARLLDYQLALTIYSTGDESQITDLFGRVNTGGHQLSPHERRQAGVVSQFSSIVRTVAAELRGDVSQDLLLLSNMPEISVDGGREPHGYGIKADETLWCSQGILTPKQLRASEDEQVIADILVSILQEEPFAFSQEALDEVYDQETQVGRDVESKAIAYGAEKVRTEIKAVCSVISSVIEACSSEPNYLQAMVRGPRGPRLAVKAPFYAIFMAFFDLVIRQQKVPTDGARIMHALRDLASRLKKGAHYETTANREANIKVVKGLVQEFFVEQVSSAFTHGPLLRMDFENALRRSRIESARYEFKQGILTLDGRRSTDKGVLERLVETACGIANVGPETDGNIFIGVADKESDRCRVAELDGVTSVQVGGQHVVGVDREAAALGLTLDKYLQKIIGAFQKARLSEPLKTQILTSFDSVTVHGLTVIRIRIPRQTRLNYVDGVAFVRVGPSTQRLEGEALVAVSKRFPE